MDRKDGFLDLNKYFNQSYHELVNDGILRYDNSFLQYFDENGKKSNHWITINNEDYYLKRSNYWEQEIVTEEFFKLLGVESLHYDVAILDNEIYIISKDYRKPKGQYVTGREILECFYVEVKKEEKSFFKDNYGLRLNARKEKASSLLNNLEDIWLSLAYRYRNNPDKEKIIYEIVNELKMRFLVRGILLIDGDYHANNWVVEETDKVKLVPNFDSESTLMTDIYGLPFGASKENVNDSAYSQLEYYLSISDNDNVSLFIELYDNASPELLQKAISKVEQERGIIISKKIIFIENYTRNYENLKPLVNKYRGKYGR